jgi:regulator of replication initiation timing
VDDGSAAHEPARPIACGRSPQNWLSQARLFTSPADTRPAVIERIAELEAERDQLIREIMETRAHLGDVQTTRTDLLVENSRLRALLSRVVEEGETTTDDPVRADVERTIDHLQRHLVKDKEFGNLKKAVEQAGRTNGKSDAAINDIRGRALR